MKNYNPKKILVSLHIQKCGGSSLNLVIKKWFGIGYHPHYINEVRNEMPKPLGWKKHLAAFLPVCVHGHFSIGRGCGVKAYYPSADQFITVIREPLELHLSNYFYIADTIRKTGAFYAEGKRFESHPWGDSVDQFLEEHTMPAFRDNFPFTLNEENYKQIFEQNFIHIGITEDLQKSLNLIAEKIGKKTMSVPHINKAGRPQIPSESSLRTFRENHKLDYLIFDYACQLNK